jgi:hypothetical protein
VEKDSALRNHEKGNHLSIVHTCNNCNSVFKRKSYLDKHLKTCTETSTDHNNNATVANTSEKETFTIISMKVRNEKLEEFMEFVYKHNIIYPETDNNQGSSERHSATSTEMPSTLINSDAFNEIDGMKLLDDSTINTLQCSPSLELDSYLKLLLDEI